MDNRHEYLKGINALNKSIVTKSNFFNAFFSENIGTISLIYGKTGDSTKNFKGGFGISHIIAKRDYEAKHNPKFKNQSGKKLVEKLIDVIVYGSIEKTVISKKTVHIRKDGYEAVLSLDLHGQKVTWLLTGYKLIE